MTASGMKPWLRLANNAPRPHSGQTTERGLALRDHCHTWFTLWAHGDPDTSARRRPTCSSSPPLPRDRCPALLHGWLLSITTPQHAAVHPLRAYILLPYDDHQHPSAPAPARPRRGCICTPMCTSAHRCAYVPMRLRVNAPARARMHRRCARLCRCVCTPTRPLVDVFARQCTRPCAPRMYLHTDVPTCRCACAPA